MCFKEKLLCSITVPKKALISTFFENLTPSQTFSNGFDNSCQAQVWTIPFGGCFCIVFSFQWPKYSRFLSYSSNNYKNPSPMVIFKYILTKCLLSNILFNWYTAYLICSFWFYKSRTAKATGMEITVSTINYLQPLTVVTKNFVVDATGVLDPCERL